jgi:hypothetical protein
VNLQAGTRSRQADADTDSQPAGILTATPPFVFGVIQKRINNSIYQRRLDSVNMLEADRCYPVLPLFQIWKETAP